MMLSFMVFQIFGSVTTPPGVDKFTPGPAGLLVFISNIIKLVTVVAGLFGLFNIISAGYTYLSSGGNAKATEQAMNQMTYSLIGLVIIAGAFLITALVSLLLFGDSMFILRPTIPTALP